MLRILDIDFLNPPVAQPNPAAVNDWAKLFPNLIGWMSSLFPTGSSIKRRFECHFRGPRLL